jgi:catechol 2,3-dioxygenase-like lactoylglutathione lyase family enzyme
MRHNMPMLEKAPFAYLFITVSDVEKARDFYTKTLGLPLIFHTPGENAFLQTANNGPIIALYPGNSGPASQRNWMLAFNIDSSLDDAVSQLAHIGVTVGPIESVPGGRAAIFNDPDGNRLELHELSSSTARREIATEIEAGLDATRAQDFARYSAGIPANFAMRTPDGQTVNREQLLAEIAQQWSIIVKVLELEMTIDTFQLEDDGLTATLVTSQRYRRIMKTRDGLGQNDVLTTQRHNERWQRLAEGWRCISIEELGGEIFVDGEPFTP